MISSTDGCVCYSKFSRELCGIAEKQVKRIAKFNVALFFFSFQGIDDDHCFDSEPTTLTSKNIQNLKCLYNYKCFVSGGERWFFMGLGVSVCIFKVNC